MHSTDRLLKTRYSLRFVIISYVEHHAVLEAMLNLVLRGHANHFPSGHLTDIEIILLHWPRSSLAEMIRSGCFTFIFFHQIENDSMLKEKKKLFEAKHDYYKFT